jgi:hypothetical protein
LIIAREMMRLGKLRYDMTGPDDSVQKKLNEYKGNIMEK